MKMITNAFSSFVKKYLPDAFLLALFLTIITFAMGLVLTPAGPINMLSYWGKGITSMYSFTMQMVLILLVGYSLASANQIKSFLKTISRIPKTNSQAIIFAAAVSFVLNFINWGIGFMGGAILARNIAKNNKKVHYPLIVAAVYAGTMVRGLSASIPLSVATSGHFLEKTIGVVPISKTLFSSWNIVLTVLSLIATLVVMRLMMPSDEDTITISQSIIDEDDEEVIVKPEIKTFADKANNSRLISGFIGIVGLIFCGVEIFKGATFNVDINNVILIFMFTGILLHGTPIRYKEAINNSAKSCGGVLLQFPFYAGIMGMMKFSGLSALTSEFFVNIATSSSLPAWTFLSAGLLNIFVPSGGGQWTIQGPIMVDAAVKLGADVPKVIMALTWGDAWTNQIQPFWALPILSLAGLEVKDIMGYCLLFSIVVGLLFTVGFIIL